ATVCPASGDLGSPTRKKKLMVLQITGRFAEIWTDLEAVIQSEVRDLPYPGTEPKFPALNAMQSLAARALLLAKAHVLERSPDPASRDPGLIPTSVQAGQATALGVPDPQQLWEHLKEKLEEYMARFSKVRIVRTRKREGLIRTRLLGASMARGEVLTFLDSHCEVNVNWLPPLLDQIALNHKTIVCPMIDVIDHNHFGYEAQAGDAMRGAFDWEMYYKRIPIPPELQRADPSDPFEWPEYILQLSKHERACAMWNQEKEEFTANAKRREA
ncbi:hypothetical protein FD754_001079, partial [Muntiacus muntjak]